MSVSLVWTFRSSSLPILRLREIQPKARSTIQRLGCKREPWIKASRQLIAGERMSRLPRAAGDQPRPALERKEIQRRLTAAKGPAGWLLIDIRCSIEKRTSKWYGYYSQKWFFTQVH